MTRPFRGLPMSRGPDNRYDAVVIGAGIGGLICANLLVDQGLKTLMVERHYQVGGYCSTFRRKGYIFDAASHFYPLLGNPETLTGKLLIDLGIQCKWRKMDPVDHFHFPDGSVYRVPADLDRYLEEIKQMFPEESGAIDAFFQRVRTAYLHGLLAYFKDRPTHKLTGLQHLTLGEVLDQTFRDRKLKLLLTADGPHWGAPPNETSFIFDSMLRLSYFLGNFYPVGGSQRFADELAGRFEARGGHVLMKSQVTRIGVVKDRAAEVTVQTGPRTKRRLQRVKAARVISNADMIQTIHDLLDPSLLDEAYVRAVGQLEPSYPCFLTHLGLSDVDTEQLRRIQGYHWNEWDPNLMGRNGLCFKLFVPTLFDSSLAPDGGHVLIVQKVLDMDYETTPNWGAHKQEIEGYILDRLGQLIPGLASKIVVKSSATALTSFRFTGNYRGAMLGWKMSPDQLGIDRPDRHSPIEGLYFTGHWTRPGGGITPVIISAIRVAQAISQA